MPVYIRLYFAWLSLYLRHLLFRNWVLQVFYCLRSLSIIIKKAYINTISKNDDYQKSPTQTARREKSQYEQSGHANRSGWFRHDRPLSEHLAIWISGTNRSRTPASKYAHSVRFTITHPIARQQIKHWKLSTKTQWQDLVQLQFQKEQHGAFYLRHYPRPEN